ncbi:uncharacterized protein LOC127856023 [Dreissena polymorpha]|nr:uncharacterized protein LOC127856023 [Dreissena polymorpha]XP_052247956.1 uncharacterized protein LOC127856023 [Dreissena polymorpha]XP_052247957.1 uncharacterized protein LOC127856023 [Dreissena polymorpha]XP_052247958.1 uncharacterized protein LOC127856023 [Dreissena polymorpha]XP_052247960.1 uncharacterized protein LOC127856023 [Dreissena polymorpha]XP_052247961.1 uncharacterized protein LOC127856023 [Dreissena polymorpha]
MAYTVLCKAHSKSASSICFTHGTFLCIKCLLEKVEEKEDCIKYDMTDIADEKYQTKLKFFTMQHHALKKQETLNYRIKEVNKEREYLVKQVEEAQETLIKDIKDKAGNILTAISNEGATIESKYQVFVKEIDEKLKPLEADIKRMESADSDIAKIRRSIEILEKELTQKYVVFGTVTADFETNKKLTETFKGLDSLGTFVLTEMEEYEPIGGEDNKAFANDESEKRDVMKTKKTDGIDIKDEGEKRDVKKTRKTEGIDIKDEVEKRDVRKTRKTEGIDMKDEGENKDVRKTDKTEVIYRRETLLASEMYDSDIRTSNPQPAKHSDNLEKEVNMATIKSEEEQHQPPSPQISQLQSEDTSSATSKCCCCN